MDKMTISWTFKILFFRAFKNGLKCNLYLIFKCFKYVKCTALVKILKHIYFSKANQLFFTAAINWHCLVELQKSPKTCRALQFKSRLVTLRLFLLSVPVPIWENLEIKVFVLVLILEFDFKYSLASNFDFSEVDSKLLIFFK